MENLIIMEKVLLSAFGCDPTKGSEPGNGWNWAEGLATKGFDVHCLTRLAGKVGIETKVCPQNLTFHYVSLPLGLDRLYSKGTVGMYLYYVLWQWFAYRAGVKLKEKLKFKVVHHVTWGSLQMGSFLYKLKIPFVFGPAGGGQIAPVAFKRYFLDHWSSETRREKVSNFMRRFNPGFAGMLKNSYAVLVSNPDTYDMAKRNGARSVSLMLDAALPSSFFPKNFSPKISSKGSLKMLWIGRFMPRKGLLLLLDVMKELKDSTDITLTVVGDGEMRESFLTLVSKLGLEATVSWKGAVPFEEVKNYYASHDVFFFTSLRDSCPAQLIEAMAYGLPVITIDLHGQSLIVEAERGIKCQCETPEMAVSELKKAILYLAENPDRVTSMSGAAHEFALKQNWENKIAKIVKETYPA